MLRRSFLKACLAGALTAYTRVALPMALEVERPYSIPVFINEFTDGGFDVSTPGIGPNTHLSFVAMRMSYEPS